MIYRRWVVLLLIALLCLQIYTPILKLKTTITGVSALNLTTSTASKAISGTFTHTQYVTLQKSDCVYFNTETSLFTSYRQRFFQADSCCCQCSNLGHKELIYHNAPIDLTKHTQTHVPSHGSVPAAVPRRAERRSRRMS